MEYESLCLHVRRSLRVVSAAMTLWAGTANAQSAFDLYAPYLPGSLGNRPNARLEFGVKLDECAAINPLLVYYYINSLSRASGYDPMAIPAYVSSKRRYEAINARWTARETASCEANLRPKMKVEDIRSMLESSVPEMESPDTALQNDTREPNRAYFLAYLYYTKNVTAQYDSLQDYRLLCSNELGQEIAECDRRLAESSTYADNEKLSFALSHAYCFNDEFLRGYDLAPHANFYSYVNTVIGHEYLQTMTVSVGSMSPYLRMKFDEKIISGNQDLDSHLHPSYPIALSTAGQPFLELDLSFPLLQERSPFSYIQCRVAYSPVSVTVSDDLTGSIMKGIYAYPGVRFDGEFSFGGISPGKSNAFFLEMRTPVLFFSTNIPVLLGAGLRVYDIRYSYSIRLNGGYTIWDLRYANLTNYRSVFDVRRNVRQVYASLGLSFRLFSACDINPDVTSEGAVRLGLTYTMGL